MKNTIQTIDYALSDFSDYTPSAFLVSALHWAGQQGFWQPFNRLLDVRMKKVVYTPLQKVQTLIASIMYHDWLPVQQGHQLPPGA